MFAEAGETPAVPSPTTEPQSLQNASFVTVAGVRVHHGIDRSSEASGGVRIHRAEVQPSRSPIPIEARAASASLETTG